MSGNDDSAKSKHGKKEKKKKVKEKEKEKQKRSDMGDAIAATTVAGQVEFMDGKEEQVQEISDKDSNKKKNKKKDKEKEYKSENTESKVKGVSGDKEQAEREKKGITGSKVESFDKKGDDKTKKEKKRKSTGEDTNCEEQLEILHERTKKKKKEKRQKEEESVVGLEEERDSNELIEVSNEKSKRKEKRKEERESEKEKNKKKEKRKREEDTIEIESDDNGNKRSKKDKSESSNKEKEIVDNEKKNKAKDMKIGEPIKDKENKKKKKEKRKEETNAIELENEGIGNEKVKNRSKKGKKESSDEQKDKDKEKGEGIKDKENNNNNMKKQKSKPKMKEKKVSFSGEVEVFLLEKKEKDKEIDDDDDDNLVWGKRFTEEEDSRVIESIENYIEMHQLGGEGKDMILNCGKYPELRGCWREIANCIPYRPWLAIYKRGHTLLRRSEAGWTKEEYEALRRFHEKNGNDWKTFAAQVSKYRLHVKDAWRRIRLTNEKKGRWSQDEYQVLFDLVNMDLKVKAFEEKKTKHGMLKDNIAWEAISDKMETRLHFNCCNKWYNQLSSSMVKDGLWIDTDDYRLISVLLQLDADCVEDVDWDSLLEHRSGEICRRRWGQMVRYLGGYQERSFIEQVEVLSKRYCPEMLDYRK